MSLSTSSSLKVATWNIAAINNNPFEYWITYDDPGYNNLMNDVQEFINQPGEFDLPVHQVFTESMFSELKVLMNEQKWEGLEETEEYWKTNLKDRKVVSEVLKDGSLGAKRLMSMPDRITNTINVENGKLYRPTAINCYPEKFDSFEDWWSKWKQFMFLTPTTAKPVSIENNVASKFVPIKKSKYPAVTDEEEKLSIPLQAVCGAIFDAILINMLERVAPSGGDVKSWQVLRQELTVALNSKKSENTINILLDAYADRDILFLQEVSNAFIGLAKESEQLNKNFAVLTPTESTFRDQNSIIIVKKEQFDVSSTVDITKLVVDNYSEKLPLAAGDLYVCTIKSAKGGDLVLASFHGDTNGLATIPVVDAVQSYVEANLKDSHKLIFGLDANTYEKGAPNKKQDVTEFGEWYTSKGLDSCFGAKPDPKYYTTFNARTFLQPQLNKACTKSEFLSKGDVNPKDFILFKKGSFTVSDTKKDNTGKLNYIENMVFPTLDFPSDHAVLSTVLQIEATAES